MKATGKKLLDLVNKIEITIIINITKLRRTKVLISIIKIYVYVGR